jgi:hypothetical protein
MNTEKHISAAPEDTEVSFGKLVQVVKISSALKIEAAGSTEM